LGLSDKPFQKNPCAQYDALAKRVDGPQSYKGLKHECFYTGTHMKFVGARRKTDLFINGDIASFLSCNSTLI